MREKSQQFEFDADANEVYDYLMGPEESRPREPEGSDGSFSFACRFLISSNPKALHSIVIYMNLASGLKIEYINDNVNWLVWGKEIAEIILTQPSRNRCIATLFIENDPQVWHYQADGPWVVPMYVGSRFIVDIWRKLIEDWVSRPKTKENEEGGKTIIQVKESSNVVINIGSTLSSINQSINSSTHIKESSKQELATLINQLQEALEDVPLENSDEAEAVAELAKDLLEKATKEKVNKPLVEVSAEGLKKAAENLAKVTPKVLTIAGKIIAFVFSLSNL